VSAVGADARSSNFYLRIKGEAEAAVRVTRSTFGSSTFNGFLALAAADVILRRDVAFDLALPFLGAALLGFRDFSMERVDMGLGSVGSRRRN
jgi:hypothetical protein